jgi:hypothetical protein
MGRPSRAVISKARKYKDADESEEESAWEEESGEQNDEDFHHSSEDEEEKEEEDLDEELPPKPLKSSKSPAKRLLVVSPKKSAKPKPSAPAQSSRKRKFPLTLDFDDDDDDEAMLPTSLRKTSRGGYAHTNKSKARIGRANRGNTPWNKGKTRSEADKAKIGAGVKARNRAILLEKLKLVNMSEDEYHAKQKEIKYLRERLRRAKLALKKREDTKQDVAQLQSDLDAAIAVRDNVDKQPSRPVPKHVLEKLQKEEEAKLRLSGENEGVEEEKHKPTPLKEEKEAEVATEEDVSEEIPIKKEKKAAKVVLKAAPVQKFPLVSWQMHWEPHPCDEELSVCPIGGPGGLVCCHSCSESYSHFLGQTAQDLEGQRMDYLSNQVEELLGFVEEARMATHAAMGRTR